MEILKYLVPMLLGIAIVMVGRVYSEKRLETRTDEASRIKRASRSEYDYEYSNKRIRGDRESSVLFWKKDEIDKIMEARLRHRVREKVKGRYNA